jgi:subtilisin family serine protease
VAGTVGGTAYGIAKGATLVGVRVFGCSGGASYSTIIAGLDWVINDNLRRGGRAVVNMSLGGGAFQAMDDATNNLAAYNIVPVVAGGERARRDACTASPARAPLAVTVGATDIGDNRASFSNFGPCLDLFAPGVNITSAWWQSDGQTATISGTSMATPHVAGMAALILQMAPTASAGLVAEMLRDAALEGYVLNAGAGSPNRLLHKPTGRLSGTGAEQVQPWGATTSRRPRATTSPTRAGRAAARWRSTWTAGRRELGAGGREHGRGSSKVLNYTNTVPSAYFRWRVANPSTTVLTTDYDLVLRRP